MVARDENGQPIKRGVYVTADLVDEEASTQGVYWDDNGDGSIQVQHVDGFISHCKPTCTVVPDRNLHFGNAKQIVMILREQNSWDYRWQHDEVL